MPLPPHAPTHTQELRPQREPTFPLRGAAPQGRPSAELQMLVNRPLLTPQLQGQRLHLLSSQGPHVLPEPGIKKLERRGTPGPAGGGGVSDCLSSPCRPGPEVGSGAEELWPGSWGAGGGDERGSDRVSSYQPSRGSWGTLGKEIIVVNRNSGAPRGSSDLPQAQLCS